LRCLQDDIDNKVPDLKRKLQPLPCPIHGHPANLLPHLRAWVDFYNIIAPYTTQAGVLDHILISNICDEYDIKFTDAFSWLNIIHREVQKRDAGKNNGN